MPKKKKRARTAGRTKLEIAAAVRKELKKPSTSSSPGIRARARNVRRTGQEVPVTTRGKADKRTPTQMVRDRRKKRFANRKKP